LESAFDQPVKSLGFLGEAQATVQRQTAPVSRWRQRLAAIETEQQQQPDALLPAGAELMDILDRQWDHRYEPLAVERGYPF
jgi:hypothetical protein